MADSTSISPYRLLADAEDAEEILILTFTARLEFFERFALGAARAARGRVTLIGDATAIGGDPALIRGAGRTYLDGRAVCPGSRTFHPKLLVIAGRERASVAVGSGNLTLAGWHHNAELWTALHGDLDQAPTAIAEVAAFLRALEPAGVEFSHGATAALHRTAALLEALPSNGAGPVLVGSATQPIIEQLPRGPVDELVIYAPFFDRELRALRALIDRFEPRALTVLLQRDQTVIDGAKLAALLDETVGTAREIAMSAYHHGKLVEWRLGERRFALTGSPNISGGALLHPIGDGGNCEIGLIDEIPDSLIPESEALTRATLAAVTYKPIRREIPAITLLGATVTSAGLRLVLRAPLGEAARVQVHADGVWIDRAEVSAGSREQTIAGGPEAWATALAVRIRAADGRLSNEVFVTDLGRVLRRLATAVGRAMTDEAEVFTDPRIAEEFHKDIQLLRIQGFGTAAGPSGGGSSGGSGNGGGERRINLKTLEDYLDACEAVVGEAMVRFGLGLPALPGAGSDEDEATDELEGAEPGEEPGGKGTEGNGQGGRVPKVPTFSNYSQRERARYQRWCRRLSEIAPSLVPLGRVIANRLVLRAVAGGLWRDAQDWVPVLAATTQSLAVASQTEFEDERVAVASTAAVNLAVLRGQVRRFSQWDPLAEAYTLTLRMVGRLLTESDPARIAELTAGVTEFFGPDLAPDDVAELVDAALHPPSELEQALRLLVDEHGVPASAEGRVIELSNPLPGDPRRQLMLAVGLAEGSAPIAARGECGSGQALAVWAPPRLLILRRGAAGPWGAVHRIAAGMSPRVYALTQEGLPRPESEWMAGAPLPTAARELLDAVGLSLEEFGQDGG